MRARANDAPIFVVLEARFLLGIEQAATTPALLINQNDTRPAARGN